ncbi:helix-turn-helix domain-containing protein, partial [Mannheimia haemolytica]|nr:helix-turn-helix domain-containing protein [Mannheimia haemolytica]
MFYSNNPLIKHKTGLLNLAEELGNISQACKVMGMSRDTFYRYQQAVEQVMGMSRDTFYRYQQAVEQ